MYLSLLAALMLTAASVCLAQSVPKSETNNAVNLAACDREWAQKLIAQQVDEGRKLSDPAMRISVLAIIADRLWTYDEPGARALFREADDTGALENDLSIQRPQSNNGGSPRATDPRFAVVEAVARHDAVWAVD